MADAWFQDKFANLQIDGNLSEVHDKLNALNPQEIAEIFSQNNLDLASVFVCVEKVSR